MHIKINKGTRFLYVLFIAFSLFFINGCSEEAKDFNIEKKYQMDDVSLQFRSSSFTQKVSPLNPYGEGYEQAYNKEDNAIMIDLQFYVENKGSKKVDLKKYIQASLSVDNNEIDYSYYMQTKEYTSVEQVSTLKAKEKSVLHIIFFMDQDVFDAMKKEDKEVTFTMKETAYKFPLKEHEVKKYELGKEALHVKDVSMNITSTFLAKTIRPLNQTESSNWFSVEGDATRYAGMYVEIENTSDQDIHLNTYLIPSLHASDEEHIVWTKLLSEDLSVFEDDTLISAKSKRSALFFGEVNYNAGVNEFTFQCFIEGVPYYYTFTQNV